MSEKAVGANVRIIRSVAGEHPRGPMHGMATLQRHLAARCPEWLFIGGQLRPGELPWVWCWEDEALLESLVRAGRPFVCGPNVLFGRSSKPCSSAAERCVCVAGSCRLLFTESQWYADLICRHLQPTNPAPVVLWPYPIEPIPDGPIEPAEIDVLLYLKSGRRDAVEAIQARYNRSTVVQYGQYDRAYLADLARRARACVYFSADDRGPLALAEILLAGCPAVGIDRGAPWCEPGLGLHVDRLDDVPALVDAIEDLHEWHREDVRARALARFDAGRTVQIVLDSLDQARRA